MVLVSGLLVNQKHEKWIFPILRLKITQFYDKVAQNAQSFTRVGPIPCLVKNQFVYVLLTVRFSVSKPNRQKNRLVAYRD